MGGLGMAGDRVRGGRFWAGYDGDGHDGEGCAVVKLIV